MCEVTSVMAGCVLCFNLKDRRSAKVRVPMVVDFLRFETIFFRIRLLQYGEPSSEVVSKVLQLYPPVYLVFSLGSIVYLN